MIQEWASNTKRPQPSAQPAAQVRESHSSERQKGSPFYGLRFPDQDFQIFNFSYGLFQLIFHGLFYRRCGKAGVCRPEFYGKVEKSDSNSWSVHCQMPSVPLPPEEAKTV